MRVTPRYYRNPTEQPGLRHPRVLESVIQAARAPCCKISPSKSARQSSVLIKLVVWRARVAPRRVNGLRYSRPFGVLITSPRTPKSSCLFLVVQWLGAANCLCKQFLLVVLLTWFVCLPLHTDYLIGFAYGPAQPAAAAAGRVAGSVGGAGCVRQPPPVRSGAGAGAELPAARAALHAAAAAPHGAAPVLCARAHLPALQHGRRRLPAPPRRRRSSTQKCALHLPVAPQRSPVRARLAVPVGEGVPRGAGRQATAQRLHSRGAQATCGGGEGQGRCEGRRQAGRRSARQAAATAHALQQPAAAGAGGHVLPQPLPRHGEPRGDRRLDQPHREPHPSASFSPCPHLYAFPAAPTTSAPTTPFFLYAGNFILNKNTYLYLKTNKNFILPNKTKLEFVNGQPIRLSFLMV